MEENNGGIREFVYEHKPLIAGILFGAIFLLVVVSAIRQRNLNKKAETDDTNQEVAVVETQEPVVVNNLEDAEYKHELGIDADKGDGRVGLIDETGKVQQKQDVQQIDPSYETRVRVFDFQKVPDEMVDGSDIKGYLSSVILEQFGTKWGSKLTSGDFYSKERILVGVKQEAEDFERGDLMSVGWLINNLSSLDKNTAVKFTNLHVVGKLADDHTCCLCCYDWYSAWGIKDTLVVFEDISDTVDKLKAGDIFSCTVYVHNMKVTTVNGQHVVCIQYAPFNENKDY